MDCGAHLTFTSSTSAGAIAELLRDHGLDAVSLGSPARGSSPGLTILPLLKAAVGTMPMRTARRLARTLPAPLVNVECEPLRAASRSASLASPPPSPADTTALAGWGIHETSAAKSPYSGAGINVALVDSGFLPRHPDFKGRRIVGHSFVPSEESPIDVVGHGTHCGAVACGPRVPTQYPRYGVAGDAQMWVLKVATPSVEVPKARLASAVEMAVKNRCEIVCMPIGWRVAAGVPFEPAWEELAQRAAALGTLILAAAGNDSERLRAPARPVRGPANCPSVVAIGAVDRHMRIAEFSNAGGADGADVVDFVAPGVDIFSAHLVPPFYRLMSGTSQAVAMAAGIAALHAEKTGQRGLALREELRKSALSLGLSPRDAGHGLVQAPTH